jgi:hypothetical protein
MRYLPKNAPPGSVTFKMLIAVQGWGASGITTNKGEWYSPEEFADEVPKWIAQLQSYAAKAREIAGKAK